MAFLTFSDLDRGGSLDASSKAMWRNPSIGRHASISHIPPDRICPAKWDKTMPIPLHTSAVVTRVARGFSALLVGQMAEEHKNVRLWGGIHFRNSLEVGEDMGRKIAAYLIDNALTPAR